MLLNSPASKYSVMIAAIYALGKVAGMQSRTTNTLIYDENFKDDINYWDGWRVGWLYKVKGA